jgi:hypothetical protein
MTNRYASLLFDTQEYHRIGPFRFPVYHDLLPGEVRAIEQVNRQNAKASYQTLKLARTIANKRGIRPSEAVQLLSNLNDDKDQDIIFEFADELEENQRNSISVVEQQAATVTVFMQRRAEVAFPDSPEDWKKTSDWSDEDTMPTKMMSDVFDFISWERDGWPTPEDAEGKAPKTTKTN